MRGLRAHFIYLERRTGPRHSRKSSHRRFWQRLLKTAGVSAEESRAPLEFASQTVMAWVGGKVAALPAFEDTLEAEPKRRRAGTGCNSRRSTACRWKSKTQECPNTLWLALLPTHPPGWSAAYAVMKIAAWKGLPQPKYNLKINLGNTGLNITQLQLEHYRSVARLPTMLAIVDDFLVNRSNGTNRGINRRHEAKAPRALRIREGTLLWSVCRLTRGERAFVMIVPCVRS